MASVGLKEHTRFCQFDGWTELKSARGGGRDHIYFIKELPDGRTLRTKVSHGSKKAEYSAPLWKQIWRDQLELSSEAEFWAVLKEHRTAVREQAAAVEREELPVWLVQRLIHSAGLREDEIAQLSLAEAEQRWLEYQMAPSLSSLGGAETSSTTKPVLEPLQAPPAYPQPRVADEPRVAAGY